MKIKVTIQSVRGHPKFKHRVRYPDGDKHKHEYFTTKKAATAFKKEKESKLADLGTKHADISDEERNAVINFRKAVTKLPDHAKKTTLSDAVAAYVAGLRTRHKSISCQDVAEKLITKLKAEGCGKRHIESTEQEFRRFNAHYGNWLACDVSTDTIDDFITHLSTVPRRKLKKGEKFNPKPLSLASKAHYRRALHHMFQYAIVLKACPSNPVTEAVKPKAKPSSTKVLRPTQLAALLASVDDEILPAIAISFFAGVRRSELLRLDWSEIDLRDGTIEITAENAKTAQRRLIPMSNNLKAWLKPFAKHEGHVVGSEGILRGGLKRACKAAKIKDWPRNAGRHSYASYHLAEHDDPGKLSIALGHPHPLMLHKHYKAIVTVKAAKQYWGITPTKADNVTHYKTAS